MGEAYLKFTPSYRYYKSGLNSLPPRKNKKNVQHGFAVVPHLQVFGMGQSKGFEREKIKNNGSMPSVKIGTKTGSGGHARATP